MDPYMQILIPVACFAAFGIVFGLMLAVAAKLFAVKTDERVDKIINVLPNVNCGGCSYTGCAAYADAVVNSGAKPDKCSVGGQPTADAIGKIMGVEVGSVVRMRAQVMCSGTLDFAKKKYVYKGAADCNAAALLAGGDKVCPNGCIGLGSCVAACVFNAIKVQNGVAVIDYSICRGCGTCTAVCPKKLIELVPWDSAHWVGCKSVEKGAQTRQSCDVGCISCRICEKTCEFGAITVNDFCASIDYSKCTDCGKCVSKCPRKIILSAPGALPRDPA